MKVCDSCRSSYPVEFTTCPKDQTTLRSTTELAAGLVLRNKYELVQKLGAGGMGAVYKARHLAFGEMKALKVIGRHLLEDDAFLSRFRAEAVLARKLQHPNVVRVEDLDATEDGQPFIVMEYVEGTSLRGVIRQEGALPVARALDIARQTCSALAAAHALGILHRDIKPDNILLIPRPDGTEVAKVLDFGLAKVLAGFEGAADQVATSTGMMMGTPHYMAPEQAMGSRAGTVDGRVDLYALGVVLYEMLTGCVPFHSDTPMGVVLQHIQAAPVPPHETAPERRIPSEASALVLRAMEKEPARRFASAEKMHDALSALAATLPPVKISPSAAAQAAAAAPTGVSPRTAPANPPSAVMPTVPVKRAGDAAPVQTEPRPTVRPRPTVKARPDPTPIEEPEGRGGIGVWGWLVAAVLVVGSLAVIKSRKAEVPETVPAEAQAAAAAEQQQQQPTSAAPADAPRNDDDAIRQKVQELIFYSVPLRDARVDVAVANGIVTLNGDAPSPTAQELIGSLASSVTGVRRVFNMVQVASVDEGAASAQAAAAPPETTLAAAPTPAPATVAAAPPPQGRAPNDKVHQLMEQARREIESGNHDAAAKIFEEVLKIDPNEPRAREGLERARSAPPRPR
jgi:serine/threonine-protein kinase